MRAVVVASIIATAESAVQFNTELVGMYDKRKDIVVSLVERSKVEYAKLAFDYEYRAISAKHEPFLSPDVKVADPIRIVRVWVNKEAWLAVSLRNGVKPPPVPERTLSCVYGKVGNVLVKGDSSGYDLLKSSVAITDEEWEQVKLGNVADWLKRNEKQAA